MLGPTVVKFRCNMACSSLFYCVNFDYRALHFSSLSQVIIAQPVYLAFVYIRGQMCKLKKLPWNMLKSLFSYILMETVLLSILCTLLRNVEFKLQIRGLIALSKRSYSSDHNPQQFSSALNIIELKSTTAWLSCFTATIALAAI